MIITIDGPSASGKSSVARALAKKLSFYYLNTGLLYRAVAYIFFDAEVDVSLISEIDYKYIDNMSLVFFQNKNITDYLFDAKLGKRASELSSREDVRESLLELQREIGRSNNVVTDGRDCGSVVFPDAEYKFFLTASLDARAKRAKNDKQRKNNLTLEEIKEEIFKRDQRDQNRKISPLKVPNGAVTIDNSELNLEETVMKFLSYINL